MKTVKWIDAQPELSQAKTDDDEKLIKSDAVFSPRPTKRKVVETEPEPSYHSMQGTATEIDLFISAVSDYAKYQLSTNNVFFKDTLMFQSRMFRYKNALLLFL